jgi:hypothetical protein
VLGLFSPAWRRPVSHAEAGGVSASVLVGIVLAVEITIQRICRTAAGIGGPI